MDSELYSDFILNYPNKHLCVSFFIFYPRIFDKQTLTIEGEAIIGDCCC